MNVNVNVMRAKLLMSALLTVSVGTLGCSTDIPVSTSSLQGSRTTNDVAETSSTGETVSAEIVNKPAIAVVKQQSASSPGEPIAQASYLQTVLPSSDAATQAPLTTLGPDDDISEMIGQATGVVLLDFYADWCGPCRAQGGILHEMEDTASQNGASIIKVDVDQHRQLASALNITSLPTLMLIKDGRIIDHQIGLADHERIAALLSQ